MRLFSINTPDTTAPIYRHKHAAESVAAPSARVASDADPVTANAEAFPRISRPVELMHSSYDIVVIGSGYGGGVAASRMARAGQSVCLLELGKERWPGEYPVSAAEAQAELHLSGDLQPSDVLSSLSVPVGGGSPTGMYHLILGKGQNAVVGNGLGGTSLINANVFLRADEMAMSTAKWPPELRKKGALDNYYDKVEAVLEPEAFPEDWPQLPKLGLLQKQAEALDMSDKFYRPKQTTRFHNGPNSCGVQMSASSLSGQDCTGINDGSKTTTLVTYLADAWNWGAEMFCECQVRYIEKDADRGGYRVYFAWHGCKRGYFRDNIHQDLMWVHAREAVFLGAGAIGTTEILLRSKALGALTLSDRVGQNMSGNGDVLAFGYNTAYETNAVGREHPSPYQPVGPTITGIIDNRLGHESPLDGYVIEEGVVPHALAAFVQATLGVLPESEALQRKGIANRAKVLLARWGSRLLGSLSQSGALRRTQTYLVMSHDSNEATLALVNDKPVLEFLGVGRSDHVKHINSMLAKATLAVGGKYVENVFSALMKQQVTAHPVGGVSMASDNTGRSGAADHLGRLFTGSGPEVHSGLIVADGAAIPASLGVNPFATIAALAERCVESYAQSRGLLIRTDDNGLLNLFGKPSPRVKQTDAVNGLTRTRGNCTDGRLGLADSKEMPADVGVHTANSEIADQTEITERALRARAGGLSFTEVMSGFLHSVDSKTSGPWRNTQMDEYQTAYRLAESLSEGARLFLSVRVLSTAGLESGSPCRGLLTGTFAYPTLSASPFLVKRGTVELFVAEIQEPDTLKMSYEFDMCGVDGTILHFSGYKMISPSVSLAPVQLWRSMSTLYVSITRRSILSGVRQANPVVARGIMHIHPKDFWSEILTLTPTGSTILQKATSTASFLSYFASKSASLFLAPLLPLRYPTQTYSSYINYTPPERLWMDIEASDGVHSCLYMWDPPRHVKTASTPLLFIPGASVDHQIFALPTIRINAVNYFTRAGYRVFVMVPRIGKTGQSNTKWTTYDARLDIRASIEKLQKECGVGKVYVVAHCMGSVALATGLLDGTIPSSWLLGLSCSQVFMNPIWNAANMLKASTAATYFPLDKIYKAVAGSWFDCTTNPHDSSVQRILNHALRLLPGARRELCRSAVCHRITFLYGRCWNHNNLNDATHRQIDRFFGGISMTGLRLLMLQGSQGHVMDNDFKVLTTPENVKNCLEGLPIFQFVGQENAVLSPRATEKTYEILCDTFAAGTYRRHVIPHYGHLDCWMGRNAWRDVFPILRAEIDRVVHGEL
ncbi:hypothetical protein SEPCBS119000_002470 [Sporothrix epigloea]|uniref:Cholesterol oxidase n=1 Tax=Sporothrix epigloea TaxID=1892477 RepID=A0ABP0DJ32_9PEZI